MGNGFAASVTPGRSRRLPQRRTPAPIPNAHRSTTRSRRRKKKRVTGDFNAPALAEDLRRESPVAKGAGGQLFVFRDGAGEFHRGVKETIYANRIFARLGEEWKRARADETLAFLRDSSRSLWPAPPADRINVANGLLNVRTLELAPHDPEFLSPVQLPVAFDPEAHLPGDRQVPRRSPGARDGRADRRDRRLLGHPRSVPPKSVHVPRRGSER